MLRGRIKREHISRWLNYKLFGGNPRMMISTRVYIEDRVLLTKVIDFAFYIIRKEREHCRNSFYFDFNRSRDERF